MGLLDSINNGVVASSNVRPMNGRGQAAADRPNATIWLNIGYEKNGKFVTIPVGIPLDTTDALAVRGNNPDWVGFTNARNDLLEALVAAGQALEPGAEVQVPLQVRVRRTSVAVEGDPSYSTDLGELFGELKPIVAAEPKSEVA